MTRINALRSFASSRDSVAWGKQILAHKLFMKETKTIATTALGNMNALVFGAVLVICSVAVGCSSEQPKSVNANNQLPITQSQPQPQPQPMPAPVVQADSKPVVKKPVVHKKPATVNYSDKTYGVMFEYPRRYAIETGNAASELVLTNPIPMNFVQPGGVALAAVELPETSFTNTDFSSAFFNVSVNKALTADQCTEFAVPQAKSVAKSDAAIGSEPAKQESALKYDPQTTTPQTDVNTELKPSTTSTEAASNSKLMLGDMELRATEAVSGEGTRQSDSKYFHVFQNGACYEFALNLTTDASSDGLVKHVDRDRVFDRLEKILATVKINPVAAPEVTAEAPTPAAAPETPAQ